MHQPEVSRALYSVLEEFFSPIDSVDVLTLLDDDETHGYAFPRHMRKLELRDRPKKGGDEEEEDVPDMIPAAEFASAVENQCPLTSNERQLFMERLLEYEPLASQKEFTLAALLRAYIYDSPYDRKNRQILAQAIIYLFRGLVTVVPGQDALLKISLHETSNRLVDYTDSASLFFANVLLSVLLSVLRRFGYAHEHARERLSAEYNLAGAWPKSRLPSPSEGVSPFPAIEEEWSPDRLHRCYQDMADSILNSVFELFTAWFSGFGVFWSFILTEYLQHYVASLADPQGAYLKTTPYVTWDGVIVDPAKTVPWKSVSDSDFVIQRLEAIRDRLSGMLLNYSARCASGAFALSQLRSGVLYSDQLIKTPTYEVCRKLAHVGNDIFRAIDMSLLPLAVHPHPYTEAVFCSEKTLTRGLDQSNVLEAFCGYTRSIGDRVRETLLQARSAKEFVTLFEMWCDLMSSSRDVRNYAAFVAIYSALKEQAIIDNKYLGETARSFKLRENMLELDFTVVRMENILLDTAPCVPALDLYLGKVPKLVLRPGVADLSSAGATGESPSAPEEAPGEGVEVVEGEWRAPAEDPYRATALPISTVRATDTPPYTPSSSSRVYLNSYAGCFSEIVAYAEFIRKVCVSLQTPSYAKFAFAPLGPKGKKRVELVPPEESRAPAN